MATYSSFTSGKDLSKQEEVIAIHVGKACSYFYTANKHTTLSGDVLAEYLYLHTPGQLGSIIIQELCPKLVVFKKHLNVFPAMLDFVKFCSKLKFWPKLDSSTSIQEGLKASYTPSQL